MPSYQEVLDSDPSAFGTCGGEFDSAKDDLASARELYRSHVDRTDDAWEGDDHQRVRDLADERESEFSGIEQTLGARASVLNTLGPVMELAVQSLKSTHEAVESAGYTVENTPQVSMGPSQEAQASSPPPVGPALKTFYEITARMATLLLEFMHKAVETMDETMDAALEAGDISIADITAMIEALGRVDAAASVLNARLATDPSSEVPGESEEDSEPDESPAESPPGETDPAPDGDDSRSTMLGRAAERIMSALRGGSEKIGEALSKENLKKAGLAAAHTVELLSSTTSQQVGEAVLPPHSPPEQSSTELPGGTDREQVGPRMDEGQEGPSYPETPPEYWDRRQDPNDPDNDPAMPGPTPEYEDRRPDPNDPDVDPDAPPESR